jgi:hypothetical protein
VDSEQRGNRFDANRAHRVAKQLADDLDTLLGRKLARGDRNGAADDGTWVTRCAHQQGRQCRRSEVAELE